MKSILKFSIEHRWFVLLGTAILAAVGAYQFTRLPIDAVPDITNVQVQVNAEAPGYSPFEVEQRVTFPIETAMTGLPHLEETRSLSRYGLSQVTVIFDDGTDIYFARQLINERLQQAKELLPDDVEVAAGPIATGLGEIFMWTVEAEEGAVKPDGSAYGLEDLRTIQDWIVKPQVRTVPGVNEVNTIGGFERQYHVTPDPARLIAFGLTFSDVLEALSRNNANVGAGYIERRGEQYLVRAPGQATSLAELGAITVGAHEGVPIHIHDVAEVGLGRELRTGAATENGRETVVGTVFMLMGENSRDVARRVAEKMVDVNATLPEGVVVKTVYDRTMLVDKTVRTVRDNLLEGAALVIAVLFVFLGNLRAALLTAMVIPLSMLFTFTGMVGSRVSANLMSLGALDFGIIVDGAVVIMENCVRRIAGEQHRLGRGLDRAERLAVVYDASVESRRAILFGQLIIIVVYVPILALTGVEGKMFRPMAITVILALLGAMLLSFTFIPAVAAIALTSRLREGENLVVRKIKDVYRPSLRAAMRAKPLVLAVAAVLVTLSALLATRMGREFVPRLDEGDIALHAMRIPGTSLTQSVAMQDALERRIAALPEVERVFSKIGTAEIATDPMPPNVADCFVMLKPRSEWPNPKRPKSDLARAIQEAAETAPGNNYEFTQPIQMRFNELIAGVRSDVAVKVFGDDMEVLIDTAGAIAGALGRVSGAEDVKVEQVSGLPMLTLHVDRVALGRYGFAVADVQDALEVAVGGKQAGEVFEGDRRFPLVVRLPENLRGDVEALKRIPILLPPLDGDSASASNQGEGEAMPYVPLSAVAEFRVSQGPNQVSRESGKRRVVVSANVRGRDIGSFVEEAERTIRERVTVPPGYWTSWGGQFEQMISAAARLRVVVPLALGLIFLLLFGTFGTVKDALLVFTGIPFALTGGIAALFARGIPLSISAGVGFIALSGVAVLNGLVMISFIRSLRESGRDLAVAIEEGALTRLRPVLMTALVASLGFVPMALATGTGAEVQRPLATVVIGGILSSTLLTLIVLPILYSIFHRKDLEAAS